jgi:DNA topoisomerase-1
MAKNLVIVESPAKAKTIEGYLGADFKVRSSNGHVRDLPKKGLSVDIDNKFKPNYEVSADKRQLVAELQKLASNAECVWLATDEDREGEAISWHLLETLELDPKKTQRITFNEITKDAILRAISKPRSIDRHLVDAQQARRILDRIVGFELSPVLWRKVRPSLSAGRVQSVAVRLIVDREHEINAFNSESFFKTSAVLATENGLFKAELDRNFIDEVTAKDFVSSLINPKLIVESVEVKPLKRNPAAPFTTSSLQQEASVRLGYAVARTMSIAQKLYEAGHITYMRTDATNLSQSAIDQAKNHIVSSFGEAFSNPTQYKTKSANAQEAHEAIRPSNFAALEVSSVREEQKLYELIWKRTMASQMSPAQLEKTSVQIAIEGVEPRFLAKGEVIKFEGFLKVYDAVAQNDEDESQGRLPQMEKGTKLTLQELKSTQRFTRGPARYSEASLVKKMEELGIGRPSTYAPTISTVQKRGYVAKNEKEGTVREYTQLVWDKGRCQRETLTETVGGDKNRLVPTDIGMLVTQFLEQQFSTIMDYHFTAQVEASFDEVAQGNLPWETMMADFYKTFHATVENTLEQSERVTGERELGTDPISGRKVIARMGKFGAIVQIGNEQEDGEKPRFASLLKSQSIQTIKLEEALELFKLPRILGVLEGSEIKANIGKFGPYVQYVKTYASIPKEEDIMEITFERAIELLEEKKNAAANNTIKSFDERPDVLLLKGKFGPYLKIGKDNFKLPKDAVPEELTLDACLEIAANKPDKPTKKLVKKKK